MHKRVIPDEVKTNSSSKTQLIVTI